MEKREKRGIEFKVGLLITLAVAMVVVFVFLLGNFSLRSGFTIYVDYKFSGNIRPGAPVKVSGIKVGKVQEVAYRGGEVDPNTKERVHVRLEVWVEDRVRETMRRDSEFFINTAGVLGEQYLEIVPGDDYDNPAIEPGDVLRGTDPPRTDLIVARLFEVLDSLSVVLTKNKDLIGNLLSDSASAIREVNGLLKDNREQIGVLLANAGGLAEEATGTLSRVNKGLSNPAVIDRTLRHADSLLVTADKTLRDVAPPTRALLVDAKRVTGLVTNDKLDRAMTVVDNAADMSGKAERLVDNVNGMVTDLRAGKGTAGALLSRDEIYADLREMIRDLKRNPWKFFWKE